MVTLYYSVVLFTVHCNKKKISRRLNCMPHILMLEASFAIHRLSYCDAYHRSFVSAPFSISKMVPETECENETIYCVHNSELFECIEAPHSTQHQMKSECRCRRLLCNINIVANQNSFNDLTLHIEYLHKKPNCLSF